MTSSSRTIRGSVAAALGLGSYSTFAATPAIAPILETYSNVGVPTELIAAIAFIFIVIPALIAILKDKNAIRLVILGVSILWLGGHLDRGLSIAFLIIGYLLIASGVVVVFIRRGFKKN
jgi:hypothetical protein